MSNAQKWDYKLQSYKDYPLPKGSTLYENDLNKVINCAKCGAPTIYGQSFTSQVIHNAVGFGYSVCNTCHTLERDEAIKAERDSWDGKKNKRGRAI